MNDAAIEGAEDSFIEELRDARDVPAVLKWKLVSLRAAAPDVCVFAFEGVEDKVVYFHWIRRIAPDFIYEPFVCSGKGKVLQLKEMLERDLGGLGRDIYFFIDRDFDDMRGHAASDSIFMTQVYSFENYLVSEIVLEELLKNEFHCHAEPICRTKLIDLFTRQYADFLQITKECNFRLFVARKFRIEQTSTLPNRISSLAEIALDAIKPGKATLEAQIPLAREPSEEENRSLDASFQELQPRLRYRGKFALMFFRKWLEFVAADRNSNASTMFKEMAGDGLRAQVPVSLDSMAARSEIADGLTEFITKIAFRPAT